MKESGNMLSPYNFYISAQYPLSPIKLGLKPIAAKRSNLRNATSFVIRSVLPVAVSNLLIRIYIFGIRLPSLFDGTKLPRNG